MEASPPSDNVYVTNLPANINEQMVRSLFGSYGSVVQCKVLNSANPGMGKCAALIRFASVQEAMLVVQMNGTNMQSLPEPVNIRFADTPEMKAQKKGERGEKGEKGAKGKGEKGEKGKGAGKGGAEKGGDKGGGNQQPRDNLYISGLPLGLDADMLKQIFGTYGEVTQCRTLRGRPGNTGQMAALVRFATLEEAMRVKSTLHGNVPQGLTDRVNIEYAEPPNEKSGNNQSEMIDVIVAGFQACGCMPGGVNLSNDQATLYIAGLPADTEDFHLYRIFSPFGAIAPKGVRAVSNPDGTCRGIGFVNYLKTDAAANAIKAINGTQLPDGSILKVAIKGAKKPA